MHDQVPIHLRDSRDSALRLRLGAGRCVLRMIFDDIGSTYGTFRAPGKG
jgi:hypothetical protein